MFLHSTFQRWITSTKGMLYLYVAALSFPHGHMEGQGALKTDLYCQFELFRITGKNRLQNIFFYFAKCQTNPLEVFAFTSITAFCCLDGFFFILDGRCHDGWMDVLL